jgi:hypothetical protein
MRGLTVLVASMLALASPVFAGNQPDKIYGVNLGSWCVIVLYVTCVIIIKHDHVLGWSLNRGCFQQNGKLWVARFVATVQIASHLNCELFLTFLSE